MLRLRVLGSLEAEAAGGVVDLGGPRQRGVLALLLVARGDVVSVDRLIDDLWRGEPPPRATGALQAYVSNLRRALEPDRLPRAPAGVLVSVPPGYAVRLPVEAVDAWRFESLVRTAARTGDAAAARRQLEEALALWRGPAYAEVAAEPWAVAEAARLEELRRVGRERLVEAMLRVGAAAEAVPEAEGLTREHPLREEGWRLLALTLYATGRQADALAALRRARATLAEELGLDPGPALAELEAAVLTHTAWVPARPPASHAGSHAPQPPPIGPVTGPVSARPTGPASEPPEPSEAPPEVPSRSAGQFVGREPELNALHAAARRTRGGVPGIALVAGDAGAGKSALLDQFRRELAAGGWRVPVGRCPEADGAPPAWAWVEALRALAGEVDPGPHAHALSPLLDDAAGGREQDAAFGRFRMHRAVAGWLAAAGDRPLAVFLDDVHRADDETLALLRSLADGLAGAPVLLVVAYRPAEGGDALEETLAALAVHAPVRLRLTGLDADQAARLVRQVAGVQPDPEILAALTERTGGNPFYLRESARLLASEGDLVATSEVPEGVRDVLRRRFARLPEVAVAVLRLAAVVGRDVEVDVLLHAAEVDEDTVLDALEAGVLAGLLSEPRAGTLRFTHALVRETLYGDLSRLRRGRWHARVAAALEQVRPGDLAALAHHHAQAASPSTARRAVDYAVAAAALAEGRYAYATAAGLYRQALESLDRLRHSGGPASGSPGSDQADDRADIADHADAERVDLMCGLTRALISAGATAEALDVRQHALALAERSGDDELLVRTLTQWDVPTPWLTRAYGDVDGRLVRQIERLLREQDLTGPDRCRLLCTLVSELDEASPRAHEAAAEAVALARASGDAALLGLALVEQGGVVLPEDEPQWREQAAAELISLGERHRLAACAAIGHVYALQVAAWALDLDAVRRHLEAASRLADRYQLVQGQDTIVMSRAMIAHIAGHLGEAEELYLTAGAAMRRHGAVDAEAIVGLGILALRITQRRLGELEPLLRGLHAAYGEVAADALALSLVELGRPEEARRVRPRGGAQLRRDFLWLILVAIRGMVVAALAERDEAEEVYRLLLPYADRLAGASTGSYVVGPVAQVLGDLAVLTGRRDDAAGHYASALRLAERCGCGPWQEAARRGLASVGPRAAPTG